MEEKDIKTVKTTRGELRYYRDWGNYDGGVVMLNAQTIDRYKAIKNEHPDADKCGFSLLAENSSPRIQAFGRTRTHQRRR